VHRIVELFPDDDQVFKKTNRSQKEQINETNLSPSVAALFSFGCSPSSLWRSRLPPFSYAGGDGSSGACREVFEGRHCPCPRQAPLSTLIILPEDEEILDFTTGDKEFWVINGAHNLCYIHPAQAAFAAI